MVFLKERGSPKLVNHITPHLTCVSFNLQDYREEGGVLLAAGLQGYQCEAQWQVHLLCQQRRCQGELHGGAASARWVGGMGWEGKPGEDSGLGAKDSGIYMGWNAMRWDWMAVCVCVSIEAMRCCFKINHTGFVRRWLWSLPFFPGGLDWVYKAKIHMHSGSRVVNFVAVFVVLHSIPFVTHSPCGPVTFQWRLAGATSPWTQPLCWATQYR